jgi:hypothetical protein
LHEYAVEPAALAGWERFRYLVEKFGFQHGRLISRFPRRWEKQVIQACEGLGEVEKKRIIEKLSGEDFRRSRTVSGNRSFDDAKDWLTNAEVAHAKSPFHAVIACNNPHGHPFVLPVVSIDEDTPLMDVQREEKCGRRAAELSNLVRLMLQNAREILFVDPHFDPTRPKWRNTLAAWLQIVAANGNMLARCEYHLKSDNTKSARKEFQEACEKLLPGHLPKGRKLKIVRWIEKNGGEKFHARYILTDIGGVRIDVGLDEGGVGETTDVSLMDFAIWKSAWSYFQVGTSPYDICDECEVFGTR